MAAATILVIENEPDFRDTLHLALEHEGYRALSASNGKEALERLRTLKDEELPSLILLDLVLPIMPGWKFLKLKETSSRIAEIPVLVISALASTQAPPKGATAILRKPFELGALFQRVQEMVAVTAGTRAG